MTDPAASTADAAAVSPAPSWLDTPGHREWLRSRFADVLTFALPSILPGGGFAYQDADGSPMPGRPPQLFLTARMAYASSIGVRHGITGSGELLDHAMESLVGLHADTEHGGWFTQPGTVTRKATYDHVHVGLASANALMVGHPLAAGLLEQVIEVIDTRLWDESTQTLLESFAPDWSDCEDYRGANANMHGLEAFLAMGTATGDAVWHRRGLAIADRLINVAAREQDWLLPEHFTADWQVLPDYNIDEPNHPVPAVRRDVRALAGVGPLPAPARRVTARGVAVVAGGGGRRADPTGTRRRLGGRRPSRAGLHRRLGGRRRGRRAAALAGLRGHPGGGVPAAPHR
jgi:sulfoquinovose isomerase